MNRTACLVLVLATLAACDSAAPPETSPTIPSTPTSPPSGGTPGITYSAPMIPADGLVGEEDGPGFAFSLTSLFQATGTVGTLSYSASPATGPIRARIDGDSLRIALVSAWTGDVSVTATTASGVRASGAIRVRSTGRCPAQVESGHVMLIPDLAAGTEWRFAVRSDEAPPTTAQTRTSGTATLRFGEALCSDGTKTQPVEQTTTTVLERYNPQAGTWVASDPETRTLSIAWTTTATETTTNAPAYGGRNPNVIPPFGRRVPRSVEVSAFASGTYIDDQGGGSSFGPRVTFTLQTSLTRFVATTNFGTAGNGSVTWTRSLP